MYWVGYTQLYDLYHSSVILNGLQQPRNLTPKFFLQLKPCGNLSKTLKFAQYSKKAFEVLLMGNYSIFKPGYTIGSAVIYYTVFQKTGTLFISFIIHSNDDQFTRNFYQM